MTNAWALLYDELNMTDNYEHTSDYYDRDRNRDPKEWESIVNGTHPEYELTADGFVWPKANDPMALYISIIPIKKPMSPTRFVRKAFLLAFAAESFSNQCPIRR